MGPKRTIDILKQAETFHQKLSEFYRDLEDDAKREDVRQFLDYLSHHEAFLGKCIHEYEHSAARNVLDAWFKVTTDIPIPKCFEKFDFRPDMTTEEVLERALEMDRLLLSMYEGLIERAVSEDLKAAFANLLALEKQEEIKMMRSVFDS